MGSNKFIDIKGQTFSRLTAVKFVGVTRYRGRFWKFKCVCGNTKVLSLCEVRAGRTKSCGCFRREEASKRFKTHGLSRTRIFTIWSQMHQRCYSTKHMAYERYGGRNIIVCKRWHNFMNFFKDMGHPPSLRYSLDRIDNNKSYNKQNCRWATRKEQARNSRKCKMITYKGKTLCVKEWSERLNIKYSLLIGRLRHGWSFQRALREPLHNNHGRK